MAVLYVHGVPKFYLTCAPRAVPPTTVPAGIVIRPIGPDDAGLDGPQAALLRAAYATSPDFDPSFDDGLDAIEFWSATWGPPIEDATVGAFDAAGRLVGMSAVCEREDGPLLADLVVDPGAHGRGIGSALIAASADALGVGGFARFNLAVHPDNVGALRLYAHMGFRLFAEGCIDGDEVAYRTEEQFRGVRRQFEEVIPSMSLPVQYGVAPVRGAGGSGAGGSAADRFVPFVNAGPEHRLPGRILATLVGHRTGSGSYELDRSGLIAAVELLSPAEVATIYDHPNLQSWRRALATEAERFVVAFGDAVVALTDR